MTQTFEHWYAEVDQAVQDVITLGVDDLPDMDYMSMYEDGETPAQAAQIALFNAGYTPDDDPDPDSTYTQEFDEFTDADPGL
ncbi:MAG: hypothetical protein HY869_20870 [Chloroflexi bacterium]|nr:hypothetical protein [Chloroflexota bacterium]